MKCYNIDLFTAIFLQLGYRIRIPLIIIIAFVYAEINPQKLRVGKRL